jgi:hypothetical protein
MDVASGFVKQFAGTLPKFPAIDRKFVWDETLHALMHRQVLPVSGGEVSLEVLSGSGRIWRAQGQLVKPWIQGRPTQVAEAPQYAKIASQWLEPIPTRDGSELLGGKRDLSPPEVEELSRFARRLWIRPLPVAVGFTVWSSIPLWILLFHGHSDQEWYLYAFVLFMTLRVDYWLYQAIVLAKSMKRDALIAKVVILKKEDAEQIAEVLPLSQRLWSLDGVPAPWRRVRI